MGWFSKGKQQLRGVPAAMAFLKDTAGRHVALYQTVLESTINPTVPKTLRENPDFFQQEWVKVLFYASAVGLELQGLNRIENRELAKKLDDLTRGGLLAQFNMNKAPLLALDKIAETMQQIERIELPPVEGLGKAMFEMLSLEEYHQINGEDYMSPLALTGLGGGLIQLTNGWWKSAFENYEIVTD